MKGECLERATHVVCADCTGRCERVEGAVDVLLYESRPLTSTGERKGNIAVRVTKSDQVLERARWCQVRPALKLGECREDGGEEKASERRKLHN